MPVFAVLFYFWLGDNYLSNPQKYLLLIQVCIILILIPIASFYLLRTLGQANSFMLSEVRQRRIPLAIQAFLIALLIFQSFRIDAIPELFFFFWGGFLSTLIAFFLSLAHIKASLHMIGISTLTFFVIGLSLQQTENSLPIIAALFLIHGLIASSRLQMQAHGGKELLIGFFTGALPQIILWYFWL